MKKGLINMQSFEKSDQWKLACFKVELNGGKEGEGGGLYALCIYFYMMQRPVVVD